MIYKLNIYSLLYLKTALTFMPFCIFWMLLEFFIYGQVQPRLVDDIVGVVIFVFIFLMWKYKSERDYLKQ